MSYSFLLKAGEINTRVIPVGTASNGKVAVLVRKTNTLNSTGNVVSGRATFTIPADQVESFSGNYVVKVDNIVVQSGDADILVVPAAPGGGGSVDLSNYFTKTEVNSQVAGATSAKADKTYVDTQLSLKAAVADLNNKANTSDITAINSALNNKANITDVNNALLAKANSTDVTNALSGKADASVVNAKANTSDVNAALANKANTADVYTKTQADAKYALIGSGGSGSSNLLVLAPADPVPANTATGTVILRKAV